MKTFSAPGKLVLVGEYAVTDGYPAVVAAVSRRAVVTVEDAAVHADRVLEVRGNDPRWLRGDDMKEQPLLFAVLRELDARGIACAPARVAVSTAAFSADDKKLGLGSSAAAAVAFAAVFTEGTSEHASRTDAIHDVARAAHRAFQGGGSGIDVAASTYGGVLRFHEGRVQAAPALPAGLAVVVAWTGVPAKTQGFVDAYRALAEREQHARVIDAATTRFLVGAQRADPSEVMRAVADARSAMGDMGRAAGIDVVTAELARIAEITSGCGGQAKPSGAGGGDVAVCFVPLDARARLETALEGAGFAVVDVTVGEPGVRLDR